MILSASLNLRPSIFRLARNRKLAVGSLAELLTGRTSGGSLCRSAGTAGICFHRLLFDLCCSTGSSDCERHVSNSKVVGSNDSRSLLAAWSETYVSGRSLARIAGWNPAGGMVVCCECCQVEVCGEARYLVERGPTECVCACVLLSMIRCKFYRYKYN